MNNSVILLVLLIFFNANSQKIESITVHYGLVANKIESKGTAADDNLETKMLFDELFVLQKEIEYILKANQKNGATFYKNLILNHDDSDNFKFNLNNKIFGFDSFEYEKLKDSLFLINGNYKVFKKTILTGR